MSDDRSWQLLEKALLASVQEQRRARLWGIFFKLLTFAYVLMLLAFFVPSFDWEKELVMGETHTALIEVRGLIADQEEASADHIVSSLRAAFEDPMTKGVILRINSPGGSPVQSAYIYDEIVRLRALHPDIKLYAVITELGASGAYYIASAADAIYADKSSLVGSIGVTSSGFGFVDSLHKLGVERRIYAAGQHKTFLDPFQPQKVDELTFWQSVLDVTHQQFVASVKKGRGERLKFKEHPEIFSGLIWSGEQALNLGLIDGFGSSSFVAREIIGAAELIDYSVQESPLDRFAGQIGASAAAYLGMRLGIDAPVLR